MAHEQVAIQTERVSHQGPAHLARFSCDWLDVLLSDGIDAGPELVIVFTLLRCERVVISEQEATSS